MLFAYKRKVFHQGFGIVILQEILNILFNHLEINLFSFLLKFQFRRDSNSVVSCLCANNISDIYK